MNIGLNVIYKSKNFESIYFVPLNKLKDVGVYTGFSVALSSVTFILSEEAYSQEVLEAEFDLVTSFSKDAQVMINNITSFLDIVKKTTTTTV